MNQEQNNFNSNNFNAQGNDEMLNNQTMYYQKTNKPKKNNILKFFAIIGGIAVGIIILVVVIVLVVSANSKKLVCKSDRGNITIMYNDKTITGYTAVGLSYDLDGQKKYAQQVGIDAYIQEFSSWYRNNVGGTCTFKNK